MFKPGQIIKVKTNIPSITGGLLNAAAGELAIYIQEEAWNHRIVTIANERIYYKNDIGVLENPANYWFEPATVADIAKHRIKNV